MRDLLWLQASASPLEAALERNIWLVSRSTPRNPDHNLMVRESPDRDQSSSMRQCDSQISCIFQGTGGKSDPLVSFQWKNPDFLLKNVDFLLNYFDFIMKQAQEWAKACVFKLK